jgi:cytochrome P450
LIDLFREFSRLIPENSVISEVASSLYIETQPLSLYHLLDPEVLGDPYPLYHRLRTEDPVHWDPFLHAWVVTRYADVVRVLHDFSADRTPTPEQLTAMGLSALNPIAQVMVKQMLFMDAPAHTRLRTLASSAFTPAPSAKATLFTIRARTNVSGFRV